MPSYRSSALLASTALAALAVGAALTPLSAYADPTTTQVSVTDLVAALTADQASTAAAATAGWVAQGTSSEAGSPPVSIKAIYAVDRALTDTGATDTLIEAEHSGTYMTIASLNAYAPDLHAQRALKAIHKPHAAWVFTPDTSLDLRDPNGESLIAQIAPATILSSLVDPTQTTLTGTPTKTVADDGTTTYRFTDTDLTENGQSGTGTLTVNASGVLTAFSGTSGAETDTATYAYGAQSVSLPSAAQTVTITELTRGTVLATLPHQVKSAAHTVAIDATHKAHNHAVKVAVIRDDAKRFARFFDRAIGLKVLTTKSVAGGVRITGTNHFTHVHVSYTITAAGKKAVVHKG